jgi:hypothetical protein
VCELLEGNLYFLVFCLFLGVFVLFDYQRLFISYISSRVSIFRISLNVLVMKIRNLVLVPTLVDVEYLRVTRRQRMLPSN